MKHDQLVIVGGGLAAARAIAAYREAGGDRRVVLVTEEPTLPYHRPPLSKGYLRGETTATPHVEEDSFYAQHQVDVLRGTAVLAVNPQRRSADLSDGSPLRYAQLLVCTGAAPRRLSVPGAELDGVFALRTVADSTAIRAAATAAERAVVVGAGFVGMEVAASLRQLGMGVTLVHMGDALFDQLRSASLSDQLLELYGERGVDVLLGEEVARFGGADRLEWVETKDGVRVDATLAVVGVGVVPNVAFLESSGVAVRNGVLVNDRFEASTPGVFAAGDVANFFDPLYGRKRRIEHLSNADYQGRKVGKVLAGRCGGYDTVSSFFSELFGTTLKVIGDTSRFDQLHEEGSITDSFAAIFADEGRIAGAISVGQSEEFEELLRDLIGDRAPFDAFERQLAGVRR